MPKKTPSTPHDVAEFVHQDARRTNIPSQEMRPIMTDKDSRPIQVALSRRNPDLDPQLVWRGKYDGDDQLRTQALPLFIQEKVKPKALIDDLKASSRKQRRDNQLLLFSDYDGLDSDSAKTEFYQHDCNWQNRMILGDSLAVMTSLAYKEGLAGKVQCIYIDPPYGIKFNSNFQWSTTTTNVKDGNAEHITREPEQVKAFRDTWRDGIHTYLAYLRDRLILARTLLADTGSVFVQIGDENVHRIRALLDEVFGEDNFKSQIVYCSTSGFSSDGLSNVTNHVLWYCKDRGKAKFRTLLKEKEFGGEGATPYRSIELEDGQRLSIADWERRTGKSFSFADVTSSRCRVYTLDNVTSQGAPKEPQPFKFKSQIFYPSSSGHWKTSYPEGMQRLVKANRLDSTNNRLGYMRYFDDFSCYPINNIWNDTSSSFMTKIYVVQTTENIIRRCLLMTTDPGDLVLDPTCGSGTTAYVAEQWGRRWITIDTSRVALALARARIMGARFPYYLLADSPEGQRKEAELSRTAPLSTPTQGNIRLGFVYERIPHISLKSIANNTEIDVIWDRYQAQLEPLRQTFNKQTGKACEEWEMPRETERCWSTAAKETLAEWWRLRLERQHEIDASIAAKAECEYLYDKPCTDSRKIRVAGPFTVESLSPHRSIPLDEDDNPILNPPDEEDGGSGRFVTMILETLKVSGVQQAHKSDRLDFVSVEPWPGVYICAEGRYEESEAERRAAVFIGPEFGTVSKADLVAAAKEAAEAGFDVLVSCAFNYEAATADFCRLGRLPVLKARMNADLHMAGELKNTGAGNLFVIFGEPDIEILEVPDNQIQVRLRGMDIYHPNTGLVDSSEPDEIACWFIDSDYNEECFFVRQAYFLGADDPYTALRSSLRVEISEEAWQSLHSSLSRPFPKPTSGRIAVKAINHLGDEVLKVFRVE
ncbi:MAG: site-specific DNA-methyltransferase [Oligosphaeraceae bacterium]